MKFEELRQVHNQFIYESYETTSVGSNLHIKFSFSIDSKIYFQPEITIFGFSKSDLNEIDNGLLNELVFSLGMVEAISYWKIACPEKLIVKAGYLSSEQILWWEKLIERGMGEFYDTNKIDFTSQKIVTISTQGQIKPTIQYKQTFYKQDEYLIPIKSGKNSSVTMSLLRNNGRKTTVFALNPSEVTLDFIDKIKDVKLIFAKRQIDPTLVHLNSQGYLNTYAPFTAYLDFLTYLCAVVCKINYIALSNGRSFNERNIDYFDYAINYQYSKSLEFEQDFASYTKDYLVKDIHYFSFLRPLYELQISRILALIPEAHSFFLSCSKGQKNDSWCLDCPKCLFAYISLFPFIDEEKMSIIFGGNMLDNDVLVPIAKDLIGYGDSKPLDCVGTIKESVVAFYLCHQKLVRTQKSVPKLLSSIYSIISSDFENLDELTEEIQNGFSDEHNIPKEALLDLTIDIAVI